MMFTIPYSYYPSGALVTDVQTSVQLSSTSGDVQTHKFTGKELDRMYGLDWYDLGARRYDAAVETFWTMDPLCEQYYHISPYAYCAGDPVNRIDPDGKRIFITGNHANDALSQIQSRIGNSILLSLNEDGSLSYINESGKKLRSLSKKVASIIDDPNTDVIMGTRDSYGTSNGRLLIGGSFMGNRVEKGPDGEVTRVITNQEINTEVLSKVDTYVKLGTSIMHELTESYEGAKIAWKKSISIPIGDEKNMLFQKAHRRATSQPEVYWRNILYEGNYYNEYFVKPYFNSMEETIIMRVKIISNEKKKNI